MELIVRFPALCSYSDETDLHSDLQWKWERDFDGPIFKSWCTILCSDTTSIVELEGLIARGRGAVFAQCKNTTWSSRMKFAQLDNTRKILTWAHDNGLAVEEVDIVGYQARDDIKALTKYVAEKCSPRTLKLSCSCEDQPEWCHVDNCDTIIELIPILAAAGTTEFSLPAHGSDPVEHLALLAQRSKADLRYNGTLMIEFDMPTELQIAQFEAMPLEPWRDDNYLGKYARKGYLQLVHIYVWDDHDIETESPVSRAGRHYRSAAWMRYLAQQLIQFFGPLAQYDLRFMGSKEASTMRMSAVSQVHDEITHTSSRAYEMIFTNAIAEIIRTTRDSRTPGWRKVVKEAEQHSSVKFERWAELEFNNTPP